MTHDSTGAVCKHMKARSLTDYTPHSCDKLALLLLLLLPLQVPLGYRIPGEQFVQLESTVVTGYGRGSKQLGVPTANMDPEPIQQQLQQLPQGVYFGWAQLDPSDGSAAADADIHKMVMNVGCRPTVNTGEEVQLVGISLLSFDCCQNYGSSGATCLYACHHPGGRKLHGQLQLSYHTMAHQAAADTYCCLSSWQTVLVQ